MLCRLLILFSLFISLEFCLFERSCNGRCQFPKKTLSNFPLRTRKKEITNCLYPTRQFVTRVSAESKGTKFNNGCLCLWLCAGNLWDYYRGLFSLSRRFHSLEMIQSFVIDIVLRLKGIYRFLYWSHEVLN